MGLNFIAMKLIHNQYSNHELHAIVLGLFFHLCVYVMWPFAYEIRNRFALDRCTILNDMKNRNSA